MTVRIQDLWGNRFDSFSISQEIPAESKFLLTKAVIQDDLTEFKKILFEDSDGSRLFATDANGHTVFTVSALYNRVAYLEELNQKTQWLELAIVDLWNSAYPYSQSPEASRIIFENLPEERQLKHVERQLRENHYEKVAWYLDALPSEERRRLMLKNMKQLSYETILKLCPEISKEDYPALIDCWLQARKFPQLLEFLENRSDVDLNFKLDQRSETPLAYLMFLFITSNSRETDKFIPNLVSLFLRRGTDCNIITEWKKQTPLAIAIFRNREVLANEMLDHGASVYFQGELQRYEYPKKDIFGGTSCKYMPLSEIARLRGFPILSGRLKSLEKTQKP